MHVARTRARRSELVCQRIDLRLPPSLIRNVKDRNDQLVAENQVEVMKLVDCYLDVSGRGQE